MASSLNVATLSITIPPKAHQPPKVTLTFCIDLSDSMKPNERSGAVKAALNKVLDNAKKMVETNRGAKISIAVSGFNDVSKVITGVTNLTSSGEKNLNSVIKDVKDQLKKLTFQGSTSIAKGLDGASSLLNEMASANKDCSHTVILLTDGEDSLPKEGLAKIQKSLVSARAKLFAIGIGKEHRKNTLEEIAASCSGGAYFDTASEGVSIANSVDQIYHQALASFTELQLTTSQLPTHAWSVFDAHSKTNKSFISEGETLQKVIKIDGNALTRPVDLSNVTFTLTYNDPEGRPGNILLPWNANTIFDPSITSKAS